MSFLPVSGSPFSLYSLNRASLSFVQHGMYDFRTPRGCAMIERYTLIRYETIIIQTVHIIVYLYCIIFVLVIWM